MPNKDHKRRFIKQRLMREIRRDVAVANSRIKRGEAGDIKYISLHAWGCGCCFIMPVYPR
jgi:hypothetical protein